MINWMHDWAHSIGTKVGIATGGVGGFGKYLLDINTASMQERVMEAGITALICGVLGAIGAEIVRFFKNKIFKK